MSRFLLAFIFFIAACGGSKEVPGLLRIEPEAPVAQAPTVKRSDPANENQKILNELRARGADVHIGNKGIVVNLPGVLFEFNSDKLTADAYRAISEIAIVLVKYSQRRISIEGHTDSIGTVAYNKKLSERRARAVSKDLIAKGVLSNRISIYGYGEAVPIASNRNEYGRARNRRVEIIILN